MKKLLLIVLFFSCSTKKEDILKRQAQITKEKGDLIQFKQDIGGLIMARYPIDTVRLYKFRDSLYHVNDRLDHEYDSLSSELKKY